MWTLAIETSGLQGSIALVDAGRCLEERPLELGRQHGQSLLPEIQKLFADHDWSPRDCRLVAVSIGPGSYTGLRVGVVCAKTWAWSVGCGLAGVPTLDAIAAGLPLDAGRATVVADAQRDLVYVGHYTRSDESGWRGVGPVTILPAAAVRDQLEPGGLLCGPGVDKLELSASAGVRVLSPGEHQARASMVGLVGYQLSVAGAEVSPAQLSPLYLRPSSAESQWDVLHGPSR